MLSPITMPVRALTASTSQPFTASVASAVSTDAARSATALPVLLSDAEREDQVQRLDLNVRREVAMSAGQSLMFAGVPVNAEGHAVNGLTVAWRSTDQHVVSINSRGEAIAKQSGTARLTARTGAVEETIDVTVSAALEASSEQKKEVTTTEESLSAKHNQQSSFGKKRSLKNHPSAPKEKSIVPLLPQPQPSPPEGDGLPEAQTDSLYAPYNAVGSPVGKTHPGAMTPAAATDGTENPGSSNFSFSVPIAGLRGRGIGVSLALTYNSRMWHKYEAEGATYLTYNVDGGWPAPGFSIGYGHLDWQGSQGYTLVDTDGTRHQMLQTPNSSNSYDSTDGTFIRLIVTTNGAIATYTDGTQVLYSTPPTSLGRSFPVKITERNGNFIEVSYRNGHGPELFTVKDTLGRYVRFYYDGDDNLIAVTVPKYGTSASTPDEQQTIRLYYSTISINPTGSFTVAAGAPNLPVRVLSDLYFPGTGAGYHYQYSAAYGMIRKITEWRGMTSSTAALNQQGTITTANGQWATSTEYKYPDQPEQLTDAPTFTRRTDDWAGRTTGMPGTGEAPYYLFETNEAQHLSTVKSPEGVITATATYFDPAHPGAWSEGLLYYVIIKRDDESRFSQVFYDWLPGSGGNNPRLNFVRIINDANQERKIAYSSYDDYNNAGVVSELGFANEQGDSAELRRIVTAYENGSGWINRRLIHLPKSVKVYKGGTTELATQVDYKYDETALVPQTGSSPTMYDSGFDPSAGLIPPHCNPDSGTGELLPCPSPSPSPSPTPPPFNPGGYRGNLTSVTAYVNAAGGAAGGTTVNTMKYDVSGNVVEETVNCCRRKTFTYDPAYNYAYPTSTTRGETGYQLTSSAAYDFNTGMVTSAKDENNQQTTLEYDPATLRNTRVNQPDGGYTSIDYFDGLYPDGVDATPRHSYITTTAKLDASHEVTSLQYFDGRGAIVRTLGANTANGRERTIDIEYDMMGRAYRTSNPYYAPAGAATAINSSGLWTTRTFDRWGRPASVKSPSGDAPDTFSETAVEYYGTRTTVTDAAGKKRRQFADALGRVVRVDEPDAAGNLGTTDAQTTGYEYDVLNNLIHTTQPGASGLTQHRYFKYDSLSRLTHERQVEQAALYTTTDAGALNNQWSSYVEYNAQSKVEYSYDARGIRTHFLYDGLNRVQAISYDIKDGEQWIPEGTPTVTYTYDTAHSGYFNKGRLTQVKTAAGDDLPEIIQNYDYDQMNRVEEHYQKVGAETYSLHYEYNMAGQLTSETYPSGRVMTINYDAAGRLSSLADAINAQPPRTLVNGFDYAGHGGLLSETFGNGAVHTLSYTNGLQLKTISLAKNNELLQSYEYKYGQINMETGVVDEAKNNGQVARIEGFIGGTAQAPVKQWQQRFSYDSIGRLSQSAEYRGDSGTLTYQSNYQYDRFGNRSQPLSLNTQNLSFVPIEQADFDKLTNRFTSTTNISYDKVGNITSDGKFRGLRYEYDANNRQKLSTPLTTGLWQTTAVYDGLGQRVQIISGGEAQTFVYDVFGQLIAEYGGPPSGAGGTQYVMQDQQGSTRMVLDGRGGVVGRHDYQPFGEEIGAGVGLRAGAQRYSFIDSTRVRYAGVERDSESGLDHADWRKYESRAGRWTSPDPLGGNLGDPQSLNRYSYVTNDPGNLTDTSGLQPSICYVDGLRVDCGTAFSFFSHGIGDFVPLGARYHQGRYIIDDGHETEVNDINDFLRSLSYGYLLNLFGLGDQPSLKDVVDAAKALIEKNKKCRDLFSADTDPIKLLDAIAAGTSNLANVGFGSLPETRGGVTKMKGHDAYSTVDSRTGKEESFPSTRHAEITLNSAIKRDLNDIARTLIHELGHAVNEVLGYGHSKIEYDASDSEWGREASRNNHILVGQSCK